MLQGLVGVDRGEAERRDGRRGGAGGERDAKGGGKVVGREGGRMHAVPPPPSLATSSAQSTLVSAAAAAASAAAAAAAAAIATLTASNAAYAPPSNGEAGSALHPARAQRMGIVVPSFPAVPLTSAPSATAINDPLPEAAAPLPTEARPRKSRWDA